MSQSASFPRDSNRIEFNCLGTIFIIREASLNRFPHTLLGLLIRVGSLLFIDLSLFLCVI